MPTEADWVPILVLEVSESLEEAGLLFLELAPELVCHVRVGVFFFGVVPIVDEVDSVIDWLR